MGHFYIKNGNSSSKLPAGAGNRFSGQNNGKEIRSQGSCTGRIAGQPDWWRPD